jgi:hypothetical protein
LDDLNNYRLFPAGWTEPPIPTPAWADDLAEVTKHFRELTAADWLVPVTNDAVRRLIRLCYFTSQVPEEGDYPRFNIVFQREQQVTLVSTFSPPIPLDDAT